jgi:starch synthase (maltosyl-transferring)
VEIMTGRFPIEDVTPSVDCGRYPAKAVVGELVPITAVSYREGHNSLGVNVVWRGPRGEAEPFTRMQPGTPGLDQWHAVIKPSAVGRWTFTVEAFDDPYGTWHNAVTKKIGAGQGLEDLANDLAEGADLLDLAIKIVPNADEERVRSAAAALRDDRLPLFERVSPALDLEDLIWQHPVRQLVTTTR